MKKFEIEIPQEQIDYLQRYGMEVDTRYDIVARIVENHKNDVDDSVLTSPVFEHYHHAAAEAKLAYESAKQEFTNSFLKEAVENKIGKKGVKFNWNIADFSYPFAEIVVEND